jgi:hypothetical protein
MWLASSQLPLQCFDARWHSASSIEMPRSCVLAAVGIFYTQYVESIKKDCAEVKQAVL